MLLPYSFAKRHTLLFAPHPDNAVTDTPTWRLLHCQNTPISAINEAMRHAHSDGAEVVLEEVAVADFERLLASTYANNTGESQQIAAGLEDHPDLEALAMSVPESRDLMDEADDAPIIRLINALLSEAIRVGASDVHIETFERRLSVRFRVDGVLSEVVSPKRSLAPLLISRIKVMARLDIAEKRIPQDGRIALKLAGREVDVRVSTLPANFGERVVMRLLDKQAARLNMSYLGLREDDHARLKRLVHLPHGILLVTGPTGSGKTTTLYAALNELNDGTRNILTAEDPIEFQLDGIGQTQVNPKVDLSFARALRAMLRQDPDVVMVGEIRDSETAQIAVQASLTGHLVLSTLHTNTAIGAVARLMDMGVEPFLLASSLSGVIAQRLVRTLCPHCMAWRALDVDVEALLGMVTDEANTLKLPQAVGCHECNHTGFKGRTAIYEVLAVDDAMRALIYSHASEQKLNELARSCAPSIREDGLKKVLAGKTTLEEVLRVTAET